jgi:hypothetical protein
MKTKEQLVISTVESVTNRLYGGITCSYLAAQVISKIGGIDEAKRRWLIPKTNEIEKASRELVDSSGLF